jgi:peroxiredoxin
MPMTKLTLGNKAVPFSLPGIDGKTHSLAEYADKSVIIVIFSCNHCPYVQAWEDRIIDIQTDYNEQGIQIIAINPNDAPKSPEDSFQKMQECARSKGFNFIYLHDATQEVARAYGAERTPEVFVFDQNTILQYHGAIDDNFREPKEVKQHYLQDALDSLLKGEQPPMVETRPVGCPIKWK